MSNELQIYRKRLIPEECILLKDDIIVEQNEDYILTKWKTLNPKTVFPTAVPAIISRKASRSAKFYRHDGSLLYWYCDIVEYTSRPEDNSLIVTDLLADIILYPDGRMHVVDLDELAEALEKGLITQAQMSACLRQLNNLITIIYRDKFDRLQNPLDKAGCNTAVNYGQNYSQQASEINEHRSYGHKSTR